MIFAGVTSSEKEKIPKDSWDSRTDWCLRAERPHLPSVTYPIHHCRGHWGKGDIWHNHGHFLDPAACSGHLSVQSLAVWADRDSANTQWTHSSIQHTADLWSICDSSRDNLLLLLDFPSSRHTFWSNLSTPNGDKGDDQSPDLSVNTELSAGLMDRELDNVTSRPLTPLCRILLSTFSRRIPENTHEHWR